MLFFFQTAGQPEVLDVVSQDGCSNQALGWAALFFHRVILCYNAVLHSLIAAVPCGLCSC
jgi:hypothetical protein